LAEEPFFTERCKCDAKIAFYWIFKFFNIKINGLIRLTFFSAPKICRNGNALPLFFAALSVLRHPL